MRIGVNVRSLTGAKLEGIGRFTYESLKEMITAHPEHEFVFFFDRKWDPTFVFANNITPVSVSPKAIHPILWYLWFEWRLPFYLKRYKIDILLSPDGYASLNTQVPTVMVIHDLAFFHFPEYFKKRTALYYKYFVPKFLSKANLIACVSDYTMNDVLKYVPERKKDVKVVGCATSGSYLPISDSEKISVRDRITNGDPYFFFVGALHPRKNILNLIKAFLKLKTETKCTHKLVIAGRYAWKSEEIRFMIERFPFKDQLIYLGSVEDDELKKLIASAYALVYPSIFEGFGIPILDAMKCDVPSITSNVSSMPEVGGDAALYVNPNNVDEIFQQMKLLLEDNKLRDQLIQKGRLQRQKFGWGITATKLWECILQVAKEKEE